MQLNLYVPKEREYLVEALDRAAVDKSVAKNMLVLDALEAYLGSTAAGSPKLRTFDLGEVAAWSREDLYSERLDHILSEERGRGLLRVAEERGGYDPTPPRRRKMRLEEHASSAEVRGKEDA